MEKITATKMGLFTSIFVFILPFVYFSQIFYGAVNMKFFTVIFVASVLGLYFAYYLLKGKGQIHFEKNILLWSALGCLVVYYLSAILGVYWQRSIWSDLLRSTGLLYLTYLFIFSFVAGQIFSSKDWSRIRWAVALSGFCLSLVTFVGEFGFRLFLGQINKELSFSNTTFAGAYLLLAFMVTIMEAVRSGQKTLARKILSTFAVVEFLSPLFLGITINIFFFRRSLGEFISNPEYFIGNARASGITAILFVIFFAGFLLIRKFLSTKYAKAIFIWNTVWIIGVLFVAIGLVIPGSPVQSLYTKVDSPDRLIVWEMAWPNIAERPITGLGPENFGFGFERHFSNRLSSGSGGEIWFDRAHNITIDSLVSTGIAGTLGTLIVVIIFLHIIYKARKRDLIGETEGQLWGAMVLAHFLQLQTSFDTLGTYFLLAIFLGYGLWLQKEILKREGGKSVNLKWLGVILLPGLLIGSVLIFNEYGRQKALFSIFKTTNGVEQIALINRALVRTSDFESLRLSSGSFIKGVLKQMSVSPDVPVKTILEQANVYDGYYQKYLSQKPDDYRARMNYSYLLMFETILGQNRLTEARKIISESYALSPDNPLTYAMDALSLLYEGKLNLADDKINQSLALNKEVPLTIAVKNHIAKNKNQFPVVTFLKLENL